MPFKVRHLLSHRDQEIGAPSSLIIAAQGMAPWSLRRIVLGCETDKHLNIFVFQRDKEKIMSTSYVRYMLSRKGDQGPRVWKKLSLVKLMGNEEVRLW